MPIDVCVLTSVHKPFDGRIFYRECRALAEAGYQVTIVAPTDLEKQERDGVTILGVPEPTHRLQRPLVWWRLYRIAHRLRPDVIHFHDPELLILVPLFRTTLGTNTKIIYDVHEYFVDSLAGKLWIPAWLRPVIVPMAGWLERILAHSTQGIVCAVKEQKPLYADYNIPMITVRNLPVAGLFENAKPHPTLNVEGFKLIYVGLILPKRGINILLETMHILQQQGRGDIHLYLLGRETSSVYMQEIQEFLEKHQLTEHVHWLGYIPHDQLKHYLSNADVGMAPGLRTRQYNNPGISTKLFEYMLCGLPIVSVDHPHRKKYIEECVCGITIPPEDVRAHAEAIAWLHDHPEEAHAMGKRGRDMVLDRYIWEKEKDRLIAFYRKLCR